MVVSPFVVSENCIKCLPGIPGEARKSEGSEVCALYDALFPKIHHHAILGGKSGGGGKSLFADKVGGALFENMGSHMGDESQFGTGTCDDRPGLLKREMVQMFPALFKGNMNDQQAALREKRKKFRKKGSVADDPPGACGRMVYPEAEAIHPMVYESNPFNPSLSSQREGDPLLPETYLGHPFPKISEEDRLRVEHRILWKKEVSPGGKSSSGNGFGEDVQITAMIHMAVSKNNSLQILGARMGYPLVNSYKGSRPGIYHPVFFPQREPDPPGGPKLAKNGKTGSRSAEKMNMVWRQGVPGHEGCDEA
jgi:hypothetical protein